MLDQGSLQVFGAVSAGVCTAAEARRDACATLERLWGGGERSITIERLTTLEAL